MSKASASQPFGSFFDLREEQIKGLRGPRIQGIRLVRL